jgi:hypothetical protein
MELTSLDSLPTVLRIDFAPLVSRLPSDQYPKSRCSRRIRAVFRNFIVLEFLTPVTRPLFLGKRHLENGAVRVS